MAKSAVRGCCFLCSIPVSSTLGNLHEEHVFPRWYLKRADGEKTTTIAVTPYGSSSRLGYQHKLPFCGACNGHLNRRLEYPISQWLDGVATRPADSVIGMWGIWVLLKLAESSASFKRRGWKGEIRGPGREEVAAFRREIIARPLPTTWATVVVVPTMENVTFHGASPDDRWMAIACRGKLVVVFFDAGFLSPYARAIEQTLSEFHLHEAQVYELIMSLVSVMSFSRVERFPAMIPRTLRDGELPWARDGLFDMMQPYRCLLGQAGVKSTLLSHDGYLVELGSHPNTDAYKRWVLKTGSQLSPDQELSVTASLLWTGHPDRARRESKRIRSLWDTVPKIKVRTAAEDDEFRLAKMVLTGNSAEALASIPSHSEYRSDAQIEGTFNSRLSGAFTIYSSRKNTIDRLREQPEWISLSIAARILRVR